MTGSRDGMSDKAVEVFKEHLENADAIELHHGDCIGADKRAHDIATQLNMKTVVHPPSNNSMRAYCNGDEIRDEMNYLDRNRCIVDESDMLIAFPSSKEEVMRSGTWSTIRYARRMNKRIIIIFTDGTIKKE